MNIINIKNKSAQTAVEYMLLLGVVAAIVLIGMKTLLPRSQQASSDYFNAVAIGVMGKPNSCGDLNCYFPFETVNSCCIDCGGCGCVCGDGLCNCSETSATCPADC